ncbi:DUF3597 domain-containing protein [Methylobacterium flocculans]|uniref:DUF3597 domain-containing protein n=1 Tax=Methylobacterium flocculans TaxID=2984843 RepID=UPI0021F334DE|nr:DUF3597 domain-containing protein [Methylobacterium sp. FF17]
MSLFGSIMTKIFGGSASAQAAAPDASETPNVSAATLGSSVAGSSSSSAAAPSMAGAASPVADSPSLGSQTVDVGQVLRDMAERKGETSNYKQSIVDLLKVLDLDSSLSARKQLADELQYTGDKEDSATMNVWLHKQVVQKLAENGGRIPADFHHA